MATEIHESAIPGFAWNISFIRSPVHSRQVATAVRFIFPENGHQNQNMAVDGLMDLVVF